MIPRRSLGGGVRLLALIGLLTVCGTPAGAFEPPPGSKNFTSPRSVPDHFSNESGPFARSPQTAVPGADRFNTATATAPVAASPAPAVMPMSPRIAAARAGAANDRGRAHLRAMPASARPSGHAAPRHSTASRHRAAARSSRHAAR